MRTHMWIWMCSGAVAFVVAGALADSIPARVAGGALDPAIRDADVYIGAPVEGRVPPGAGCRAARSYIELVASGQYDKIAALFTADAAVLEPSRRDVRGRDAIARFYQESIGQLKPHTVAVSYAGDDTNCFVTIAVRERVAGQDRYRLVSVDQFTLDSEGKVTSMVAFVRPSTRPSSIPSPR